jgi:hypothetical protein
MSMTWEGKSYRSFVRSLVRSFVCRCGKKRMTKWRQKSNDEGKKEQNKGRAKNNLIANRGLKAGVHRHTLLRSVWAGSCSWASIYSISLTYQSEHATTFSCYDVDLAFEWRIGRIREDWMLPNGIAGVEFHHEHRVLYKSLPEHNDHLYKRICSDGRLNRIARTELFRRQSVMSFADRREQLLTEAGRWVNGGMCKIK